MICQTCGRRRVPRASKKHCSRACNIHAADRRRRGLPAADPGYKPKGWPLAGVLCSVRRARDRARLGVEADFLHYAVQSLVRSRAAWKEAP